VGRRDDPRSSGPLPYRLLLIGACLISTIGCSVERDDAQARASAAPTADAFDPLPAAPGRVVSKDGRISAPIPAPAGWACVEEQHGEAKAAAVALRCRREDPREFLFMAAKTHRQPKDQRVDAETVLMTLYRADNEAFFETVGYLSDGPVTLAGAHGWEAELEAEHTRMGTIHKRERLSLVGDRVFAVSAEGRPDLWRAHKAEIEAWFDGVRFARQRRADSTRPPE